MPTSFSSKKQRFSSGFRAGLIAGILATGLMLLLSLTAGGISLPQALGSALAQSMSPALFEYLHRTIGGDAKYYLFIIITIGQCLVFALAGGLYLLAIGAPTFKRWRDEQGQLHWLNGVVLALLLWLFTGLVFLPLVGAGIFGSSLVIGAINTMDSLAAVGLAFGILFVLTQNWLVLQRQHKQESTQTSWEQEENKAQRRGLVRNGLLLLGVGAIGAVAWRFISGGGSGSSYLSPSQLLQHYKDKVVPPPVPNYGTISQVPHLSAEITPNDQFYVVSKNLLSDPSVNGSTWNMSITGMVNHPYTLTYQQLTALPMKQQYESMMCISNEVGGQYMSNALWEGIPLVDLLSRAGVQKGASKVVLYAADDYSDSIHLSKALEPTTLVAVKMNGAKLPQGHGYPARLLVPGIYGMKHVKWITKIDVVNTDYQGYWQQSGWSDAAPIRMTSRIDTPLSDTILPANTPTYVAGVAFSGNKGISEVDVSFDKGNTWQQATLKKPLSDLTWVLWELPWQPKAGTYVIAVRAIDKEGNVQDPQTASPAPDGSSGYHSITVVVR